MASGIIVGIDVETANTDGAICEFGAVAIDAVTVTAEPRRMFAAFQRDGVSVGVSLFKIGASGEEPDTDFVCGSATMEPSANQARQPDYDGTSGRDRYGLDKLMINPVAARDA
jgi:hypothetical protein